MNEHARSAIIGALLVPLLVASTVLWSPWFCLALAIDAFGIGMALAMWAEGGEA